MIPSRMTLKDPISPAREKLFNDMASLLSLVLFFVLRFSKRRGVGFAGADTHCVIETEHENLAIADLSGFRGGADRFDDLHST